jgi:hypothetical protein
MSTAAAKKIDSQKNTLEIISRIANIVRSSSLSRISDHAPQLGMEIDEFSDRNFYGRVFANWMSLVLISGPLLRITFMAHFNQKDIAPILADIYNQNDMHEDKLNRKITDYMKEYCNLTAGHIKKIFGSQEISVGISLPVLLNGFDAVYMKPEMNQKFVKNISDAWILNPTNHEHGKVICSTMIELFNIESLLEAKIFSIETSSNTAHEGDGDEGEDDDIDGLDIL